MLLRKLLIVSHVTHYRHEGRLYAYGPYAREIDVWADLFPQVTIAAPLRAETPPADAAAFSKRNLAILPQKETGGATWRAKVEQLLSLPALVWGLTRAMRGAEAIHVRCPGNLGLLGAVMAPLFSRYLVAKYAGQWNGYPREARTVRLQRAILRSRWWRGPVTVYGQWPHQPPHIVPFFTSIMTRRQMERARRAATGKTPGNPLRVLYVGRLSTSKRVDTLLAALQRLKSDGLPIKCKIVGDGEQRAALEAQVEETGLKGCVKFAGAVNFDQVLGYYERNDVLVLVSETEGWPKAIAEGMAFGLVCIGANQGMVSQMLDQGRGLLVPTGDVAALETVLRRLNSVPGDYADMSQRAAAWAQQYTLESLQEALRHLLESRWHVRLGSPFHQDPPQEGVVRA